VKRKPTGPRYGDRIAYLRFKLSMLDKWIHQLNVERRYTDNEFLKLSMRRDAAGGGSKEQP
jgi:hypothetical protein